jgi:hypothetical protein
VTARKPLAAVCSVQCKPAQICAMLAITIH